MFEIFVDTCLYYSVDFYFVIDNVEYHFNYGTNRFFVSNNKNRDIIFLDKKEELFSLPVFNGKCLKDAKIEGFYALGSAV